MEYTAQGPSCPWTNVLITAPTSPARGQEPASRLESSVLRVSEGLGDASQGREVTPLQGRRVLQSGQVLLPVENQPLMFSRGGQNLPPPALAPQQ